MDSGMPSTLQAAVAASSLSDLSRNSFESSLRIRRRLSTSSRRILPLLIAIFALSDCFEFNANRAVAGDPLTDEQVQALTPAERGYHWLTNKAYGSGQITEAEFNEIWRAWPEELKRKAQMATAEERRKMAMSRYGLVDVPDQKSGPPLGAVEDADGRWASNCLSCHGGKIAGMAIPGLGNSHFAFQTLTEDSANIQRLLAGKKPASGGFGASMFSAGRSNGTTNAQVFSILLTSLRDNDLSNLTRQRRVKFKNHDLDAPPFWNVKKKSRLYIDGFVPKSHRVIMQFVLGRENSGETIQAWEDDFKDILAWIESLERPEYPWSIDRDLAQRGELLFNDSCAHCHGTYGPDGDYPELMVNIEEVGTDPVRLTGMPPEHRRFYRESWFGEYGKLDVIEEPEGYVAPPLDGVWASAPYFHNGSVPTLWHVMHPDERPAVWLRDEDGYDKLRVGLEVTEFDELPSGVEGAEARRYFNTGLKSKSASGHLFPNELSETEKQAVIEYLKTL